MKKLLLALAALFALSGAALAQNYGPGPQPVPIGTAQVIGNQGLPIVLLGTVTYGNNGAGTLATALTGLVPTNAVCVVPLHSISSSVPAVTTEYYCTFSAGSAVTFFNNIYTTGTPLFPTSPTAFVATGNGSVAGVATQVALYNYTLPANSLGLNGGLRMEFGGSYTNTASNKTYTALFGATILFQVTATTSASLVSGPIGFKNAGVTGVQSAFNTASGAQVSSAAIITGANDTTTPMVVSVQGQNAAPATNNMVLANTTVELLPSVP